MLDILGDDDAHEDLLEIGGRRQKEVPVGKLGTELLQQLRGLLYYKKHFTLERTSLTNLIGEFSIVNMFNIHHQHVPQDKSSQVKS